MHPTDSEVIDGIDAIALGLSACRHRLAKRPNTLPPAPAVRLQRLSAELQLLRRFAPLWPGEYLSNHQLTDLEHPVGWPDSDRSAIGGALHDLTHKHQLLSCDRQRDGSLSYGVRKRNELPCRQACVIREAQTEWAKLEPWVRKRLSACYIV